MSRIGKKPVVVPPGIQVKIENGVIAIKGPKGELRKAIPPMTEITTDGKGIHVAVTSADRRASAMQGLARALVQNMVIGVSAGYSKTLELVGVGYRASMDGQTLLLNVGYTKPLRHPIAPAIKVEIAAKDTQIILTSSDKEILGQTASTLRSLRLPEPYKGKGIRYLNERIRQKAGKAAGK